MSSEDLLFRRYLPPDQEAALWGWQLLDAGHQQILPGEDYPPAGHPAEYQFNAAGWRTLDEYQMVFIYQGRGKLATADGQVFGVKAGTVMIIFPGEPHRYAPEAASGWNEYWVGFRGAEAERMMPHLVTPQRPVVITEQARHIKERFEQILHWVSQKTAESDVVAASCILQILALMRHGQGEAASDLSTYAKSIWQTKMMMAANIHQRLDLEDLSRQVGMTYTHFRRVFKKYTGYAPREYENLTKLNYSKSLLRSKSHTISAIADQLGYTSIHYYSRAFKKQFGVSPREWVNRK